VDWTLVELNKVISLSGLTTLLISFLPFMETWKMNLLFVSMSILWVHSSYSMYKFYGYQLKRILAEKQIKQISILLGAAGQFVIAFGYFGYITFSQLIISGLVLSIAHFITMEVDYKYVLQVRPYAYLPLNLALFVLYFYFGYFVSIVILFLAFLTLLILMAIY
jgi:hypothetical protein